MLKLYHTTAGAGEVTNLGFAGATYMQDVNKSFCDSINNNGNLIEGRLMDERDGKIYWVAKLKDGNCWMTQNLDYDLPELTSTVNWGSDNNTAGFYNPGEKVFTSTTAATTQDVTGWTASSDSNYTKIVDTTSKTYNAHYLQGNYYSWPAATDGACPGGWQLPLDGMYAGLFTSYGTNSGIKYGNQDIRLHPLFYFFGGGVIDGSLSDAGSQGWYWSSTASSAANAYYLYFYSSDVYPSSDSNRYLGLSVRCVAR